MITAITGGGAVDAARSEEASMGKDDFIKLLVAQLENQDPLDPLDNAEFTAQLAQFSSLEQLFDINKNLNDFQALQSALNNTGALNFLGREVRALGNAFSIDGGQKEIAYLLNGAADDVYMGIYNTAGDLVRRESLGALSAGDHTYLWDGRDANGVSVPAGVYTFEVAASGKEGPVESVGYITGEVDGISFESETPVISVNGVDIGSSDIKTIK